MSLPEVPYKRLFLRGFPVKLLVPIVMENFTDPYDLESQKEVLDNTVLLQIVKQYPLKTEYMLLFMKLILQQLEDKGFEVCDEWYNVYCELLNSSGNKQDTHFRHFMIHDTQEICITVQESVNCISLGTTGLFTWQASQSLVNWCTSHKDQIQDKRVLELGSGVGLAGLTISFKCKPKSFWFSDCHPSVLEMLVSNVKINAEREVKLENNSVYKFVSVDVVDAVNDKILYQSTLNDTAVFVIKLPWKDIPGANVTASVCPDIILGADLIYDDSSFTPLARALAHLVTENCMAVFACTVRNEETINTFVEMLGQFHFTVEVEQVGDDANSIVDLTDTPIRILCIRKGSTF